jgi:DNA invertase Pin-like site-specific DNA recombinase
VGFRSLQESIDTTTGGRLLLHVFGSLAEFSVISTRRAADVPALGLLPDQVCTG